MACRLFGAKQLSKQWWPGLLRHVCVIRPRWVKRRTCYAKLWRHNDLIYAHYYHCRFVNKSNCSKHDVTMVSGSQATVRTCNDYSGSSVRSFCSRCGRHDPLSFLTVITKVLVECIIEPAHLHGSHSELRVCQNLIEQSKENEEIGIIILPYR